MSFSSGRSILENLKVSKKLNSVSGCSLEVLNLIFVVSCHNKSCIENDVVFYANLLSCLMPPNIITI